MNRKRAPRISKPEEFVVGFAKEGFCWLLPDNPDCPADDQNLELARRFTSLPDAIAASLDHGANVFEIIDVKGTERIGQLMVDLDKIKEMPFDDCYRLSPHVLVGPSPVTANSEVTERRILSLWEARIECIVSLLSKGELFWTFGQLEKIWVHPIFRQNYFSIPDRSVPTSDLMKVILDKIDNAIRQHQRVFVHCYSGRGRSGMVGGCLIARRGIAIGQSAINYLARVRFEYGLFSPSPETEAQCEFVKNWKEGQ